MEKEAQEGNSPTLRDTVAAVHEKMQQEPEAEPEAPEEPEGEEKSGGEEKPEESAGPEEESKEQAEEDPEEPEGDQGVEVPKHLPKELQDYIKGLDDEGKEKFIAQVKSLESGYNKKFQETAEARKFHERLSPVLQRYERDLALRGIQPEQAIQTLFEAQRVLDTDPVRGLAWLLKSYGGQNPKALLDQLNKQFGGDEEDYSDPQFRTLEEKINKIEGTLTQKERQESQNQKAQAQAQIEAFKNEKDSGGELKHPHFEEVKTQMGALMQADPKLTLEEAYNKAIRLSDEHYQAELEKARQAAIKAQEEARKKAVQKSKAASRNASSPKTPPSDEGDFPKDLRTHVRQNLTSLTRKERV